MIDRMIIRNGIKTNLRAKGRSALFFILIFLLTAALVLSLGVDLFCRNILRQCDQQYHSIALIEYMGTDYPDETAADSYARESASAIAKLDLASFDGVKRWTPYSVHIGNIPGYRRSSSASVYGNYAVLEVRGLYPYYRQNWEWYPFEEVSLDDFRDYLITHNGFTSEDAESYATKERYINFKIEGVTGEIVTDYSAPHYYTARISNVLYSNGLKAETLINIVGAHGFTAEKNDSYFVNGVVLGKNAYGIMNSLNVMEIAELADGSGLPYEKTDAPAGSPAPERFTRNAELYNIANNYIEIEYAEDLDDIYEFNQGILYLEKGDLSIGSDIPLCVISEDIAARCSLDTGDVIDITELASSDEDLFLFTIEKGSTKVQVAGITGKSTDMAGHIWVIGKDPAEVLYGYHIGTLYLENEKAASAAESIRELMPQNVRVSLYDQGYQDAARPFIRVRTAAANVFAVTCFASAAVLFLFAYLYITRQRQSVRIMVSLGTPKGKIALFLLSGALLISCAGALAGTAAGRILLPYVFSAVDKMASGAGRSTVFYSETMLGISRTAVLDRSFNMVLVWICGAAMIAASAVLCAAFLSSAFRDVSLKKGVSRARVPKGKTSVSGRGSLRFAGLSIARGGLRSLIVPLVCLVLSVVVIFLGSVYGKMRSELDESLKNTQIDGIAVSVDGKYYSRLAIPVINIQALAGVEDLEGIYVSQEYSYYLESEIPQFGNSGFSQESRMSWIQSQPRVVACNALKGSSEFYYSEASVEWLSGWDESFLADPDHKTIYDAMWNSSPKALEDISGSYSIVDTIPAVVSDSFAEAHGLDPGDSFMCTILEDRLTEGVELPLDIKIVGIYHRVGSKDQIYIPLAYVTPLDALFSADSYESPKANPYYGYYFMTPEDQLEYYYYRQAAYSTCRFTLSSADQLEDVRGYLRESGFSGVGRVRTVRMFIILRDASYLKLTDSMNRFLRTGGIITGMISAVLIAVGFIISWLMIHTRKTEFALMRGFGSSKVRIFFSFFLEQALLCLCGCAVGCLVLPFAADRSSYSVLAVCGYFVCYLLGTVFAIAVIGKTKLMELLSGRE